MRRTKKLKHIGKIRIINSPFYNWHISKTALVIFGKQIYFANENDTRYERLQKLSKDFWKNTK